MIPAGLGLKNHGNLAKLASDLHRHRNLGAFPAGVLRVSRNTPRRNLGSVPGRVSVASCGPVQYQVHRAYVIMPEGEKMADREGPLVARVERGLYEDARCAAGLPDDASQGQVIRYALAVLAGRTDPRSVAIVPSAGEQSRLRRLART